MEKVILIVFLLNTQSSYTHDGEYPATLDNFDTIQWWLTKDGAFRISTFAKTNDIHIYQFDKPITPNLAIENTHKHYSDIIKSEHVLEIPNENDSSSVQQLVHKEFGKGELERISHLNTGFWNYDGREYKTQTEP